MSNQDQGYDALDEQNMFSGKPGLFSTFHNSNPNLLEWGQNNVNGQTWPAFYAQEFEKQAVNMHNAQLGYPAHEAFRPSHEMQLYNDGLYYAVKTEAENQAIFA